MADLYHYSYLNANGYLKKFQVALGLPNLDRGFLTKILKIWNQQRKLKGFIVPDDKGNLALYNKNILNQILGIDATGIQITSPKNNIYLMQIDKIADDIQWKEIEKEFPQEEEPEDYTPEDSDMQKVSDKLIYNDNYGEVMENKKRTIIITESQFNYINSKLNEGIGVTKYSVEPDKVKIVKKYLDDNFVKGGIACMGEDGYPTTTPIVAIKGTDGLAARNMSDKQLFALLQDKFGKIYNDKIKRNKFLQQIIKDWYYDKISKEGMLSKNLY